MTKVSKILDLESVPCPLNVVKCKLALEKLSKNENLIVNLDRGEPEEMVKNALQKMGFSWETIREEENTIRFKIFNENR